MIPKSHVLFLCMLMFAACKKNDPAQFATLTTVAATNVTSTGLITGGNITGDGHSGISQRGVVWATHPVPTLADSVTNDGSGSGIFASALNNVQAHTTYYIRAYAINGAGTAYGNEISITTSEGLATVATSAITNIQPLSAMSGGTITNDGGAGITERGIVYSPNPNPTTANFKIISGNGSGTFTSTLSPLSSQQTYYVRAYAVNSYGTAYGNQLQFNAASANTVTDIDGNVYPYVTLCNGMNWMATNLKVTKYKNGDAITNGLTGFDWTSMIGAYTFPNGEVNKKDTFGLFYNVYAIRDTRGICPTGWHLPTDNEWKALEICQGMSAADADLTGLRGTIGSKFLEGGSTGLNLLKAGYLLNGQYKNFGAYAVYAGATQDPASISAPVRGFNIGSPDPIYRSFAGWGTSLRCVKD